MRAMRSPLFVRMHPKVRRNLARLRQLDHVHGWSVAAFPARSAFQRCFELPQRRVAWPADGIERQARSRVAAVALNLQPAEPAIEALRNRRRRLRRPATAFHPDRSRFGFGAVGFAKGLDRRFPRVLGADPRAQNRAPIDRLARLCAHGAALQPRLRGRATPLGLEVWGEPMTPRLCRCALRLRRGSACIRVEIASFSQNRGHRSVTSLRGAKRRSNPFSVLFGYGLLRCARNDGRLSQRLRLHPCLDRRQGFIMDPGLEAAQSLIDRNKLDDGAP